MRKAASIALIVIATLLCLQFFIRPSIESRKSTEDIDEGELVYMGDSVRTGNPVYMRLKEEVKDWTEILKGLAPILTLVSAYLLKRKS